LERDAGPFESKETSRQQDKPWRGPLGLSAAACELLPPFYLSAVLLKKDTSFCFSCHLLCLLVPFF